MTRKSRLPEGGTNLFATIKAKKKAALAAGHEIVDLAIGQPSGAALLSARRGIAEAAMSDAESMWEYQDNGSPGVPDFAQRFVRAHVVRPLYGRDDVDYLPIPGIKPMLGLIPLSCGAHLTTKWFWVATTTNPGYPTPRDWAGTLLSCKLVEPVLNPQNGFRFSPSNLGPYTQLVMTNYPHNPSGQIATREWWEELCLFCQSRDIRLFNDAAYIALERWPGEYALNHGLEQSCSLADVALDFPELSWAEGYSASKLIANGTGVRVGAMVGSPDFIADIAKIKGNTDSGFAAPMAAGVLAAIENDPQGLEDVRACYSGRLEVLIKIGEKNGLRLAVEPGAGFFTLWQVPTHAFGVAVQSAADFNDLMIDRVHLFGVPFDPGYIRYSVATGFNPDAVEEAFRVAMFNYEPTTREGTLS